jgi:transposase
MPEQRRKFSPQFRAEAVQMVLETGKPIAEGARDLGINEGTLGNWVNIWRRENPETETGPEPHRARPREGNVRRNPSAADGERVPKKAAAFFARTQP